jgi:hypothetical protein
MTSGGWKELVGSTWWPVLRRGIRKGAASSVVAEQRSIPLIKILLGVQQVEVLLIMVNLHLPKSSHDVGSGGHGECGVDVLKLQVLVSPLWWNLLLYPLKKVILSTNT